MVKRMMLSVLVFCAVFAAGVPAAKAEEQYSKWDNLRFITTDELKRMVDARGDFLLINTLSPIEHAEIAIKGSVNIPYEHLARGTAKLPENKNKRLIFYCKGPK